ncbi:MAG: prefoldin subunit alpha [Candidatus Aenigmarchaeota archaeon]|nr:prefoldin subunit alpha [Candidatus Aenigmarchaeota archaeon]
MDRKEHSKEGEMKERQRIENDVVIENEVGKANFQRTSDVKREAAVNREAASSNRESREMQEKVILYQLLQKHLESLTQNAVMLERRYEEIEATRLAVEDIEKAKESEILVPLGSGLFTYGKIVDSKKMLVDAGAGVFMDKDTDSSKRLLEERKQELEKLAEDMQHEIMDVYSRLNSLAMEIEGMSQEPEHKEKKHKHDSS